MGAVREALVNTIYRGRDPFAALPTGLYAVDLQGWNSSHPILTKSAIRSDPIIVVEIGVWKGASVVAMANAMKNLGIDGVVVAVDTWLGSSEHWTNDEWFKDLSLDHGYPSLSRKFMNNVVSAGLSDYVLPLALDSLNARQVLATFGVEPDVIHLDGGHDYEVVLADIEAWWPCLKPGGIFIGDDYNTDERLGWQGVRRAFDEFFFNKHGIQQVENSNGKCWIVK